MECYHGKLSSSLAEERLRAAGTEGAYLVRESIAQGGAGRFILSRLVQGQIKHTLVPSEFFKFRNAVKDIMSLVSSLHKECLQPLQPQQLLEDRKVASIINVLPHHIGRMIPGDYNIFCIVCRENVPFADIKTKEKHVKEQHKVSKCDKCGKFFPRLRVSYHRSKCGLSELTCDICEFKTHRIDLMEKHQKNNAHKTGERKVEPMKPLKCSYSDCNEYLKSESKLRKHEDSHTNLSCPRCGKTFSRVFNRDRHMESRHMTTVPEQETHSGPRRQWRPKQCPGCHKTYRDKSKLKRHVNGPRPCKMLEPESTIVLHI